MMHRRLLLSAVLAMSWLVVAAPCAAQTERGTISGVVTDTSGAVVPGVAVKVVNTDTNVAANLVSSESGTYSAVNLQPGAYRVEATLAGFQTSNVTGVSLPAGGTVRIDVTLNLGAMSEAVTVAAEATPLQTEDARILTSVPNKLIDELPLVVGGSMRSPYDLVSTVPEARGSGSLGGGQARAYGATLDGISVNTNRNLDITETALLAPSLESITEFNVETNGFKPEYGQAAGGLVTFASKSGTNKIQGSAYEFFRHDALDRKSFFEIARGTSKGIYKQSDFGGSLGGPVKLGRLYNGQNRTFFFATYEGFFNREGSNASPQSVPTPEMWNGDFSNWVDSNGRLITIYDPATTRPNPSGSGFIRDPFPGNRIPQERFSTVAKQYVALGKGVLTPNVPGATPGTFAYVNRNFLLEGKSTTETTHKFSVKVDHVLSGAHRVSYLFNRTNNDTLPGPGGPSGLPEPFSGFQTSTFDADLHRASWDWVGAKVVNHLTLGANTFNKNAFSLNSVGGWKDKVCIPRSIDCDINMGALSFSEFTGWGSSSFNGTEQPRLTVKNDTSFISGAHTVKAGFTYDAQEANGFGQQNIAGTASFSYRQTGVPGQTTFANAGGSSFASFLLGMTNGGSLDTPRYLQQNFPYYGVYAQDDWRVTNKLVVNYGVRYELSRPPWEGSDKYAEFSPTTPNPKVNNYPGAIIFAGDGAGRTGKRILSGGFHRAIAPRASVAFSVNQKTTVRGGVGRSFGRVTAIGSSNHSDGFVLRSSFSAPADGFSPAFTLDQGLPAYNLPPFIDPSVSNNVEVHYWNNSAARPATYDTWTISLQREVRRGMTVEVDYNGSKGSHLNANLLNINQVPMSAVDALVAKFGKSAVDGVLRADITSATGASAGVPVPYASFTDPAVQANFRSVAQALRAFPQYQNINTTDSGGDKTGRSTYHAAILKVTQRVQGGLMIQASYVHSKLMSDADAFSGGNGAMDTARPELEYSVSAFDQTHIIKINSLYELPFGEGRRWLQDGIASHILGGWRLAAVQSYSSGTPIGVTTNAPLQIFNRTNRPNVTGQDWRAPIAGDEFNPLVDRFLNRAAFVQPVGELGNAPRTNPDVRRFWNLSENISLAKTVSMSGGMRFDIRLEAFNVLNRVVWGGPNTDFNSTNFGEITGSNSPRQMQFGFKLYW